MEHKTVSLADQVFTRLESEILSGKYSRGEILTELKLSEELGVSRTPIREAIRRLEQEHIIEVVPKGIEVLGITRNDVIDIFKIRTAIEGFAAAAAAENITDEQINELKETVELQEFYVSKENADSIKLMDNKFHESIYKFSGSTVLYDTLVPLHRKTQKARKHSVSKHSRAAVSVAEHRAIYEAIASHNAKLAEQLTVEHIKNAEKHILGNGVY